MSSAIEIRPRRAAAPPRWPARRVVAVLVAVLLTLAGVVTWAPPAHAGSHGAGYGEGVADWLGAYVSDSDGRQTYCIDIGVNAPFSASSSQQTVTSLDSLSRQQLAELNYVTAKWGQSADPAVTSAVALFVWSVTDAGDYNAHGMSGDDYYVTRAPAEVRGTILGLLAGMRAEAAANAVADPSLSVSVSVSVTDQYAGTLTVDAHPAHLQGPVTLTGARFDDGATSKTLGAGQFAFTGTPADGAASYQIGASMEVAAAGYGAAVELYQFGVDEQRTISSVAGAGNDLSAQAQTPQIDLDFQPVIGTQVASRYVAEGEAFVDELAAGVTKGTWTILDEQRIPVVARGTLYGPFQEQPAEADSPPPGAPVAGVEELTLNGAGAYTSAGGITASSSGFYTWVWEIDQAAQGEYARYLTGSFTDRFGQVSETSVTPFQPTAVSAAQQRLVVPGDQLTDELVVGSVNGAWLKVDGEPIPVVLEGTLYQVPGTLPAAQSTGVDADAVPIGTVTVSATGPGTYLSPAVTAPAAGFVTWVWQVRKAAQPAWVQDYLTADWQDDYGVPEESTSVRWPVTTTSEVREYNVHDGGRAFDLVTVSGFPADHGDFDGDGYWEADVDELRHTVYGPFDTDTVLTDDLDLQAAPVLTEITTPARNGVYRLGYTDEDRITPAEPGYYVIVTSFAGDDRVQPYTSSPADILERFYVPPATPQDTPPTVITQATPEALAGEPFDDTALVQGTVPEGATLVFRAYGPVPEGAEPVCETPFYESGPILVTGPGFYESGTTTVDGPGSVYWIETLYDDSGEMLAEGYCGAPGETTTVTAPPEELTVTTSATPAVELGQPARDTATVTGTVPAGATLGFEAYRQSGDAPACTDAERVASTAPIRVDGPGEYTSEDVVFAETGTYYWIETIRDTSGTVIARGACGAPGETTIVTGTPATSSPPSLAATGAETDWLWPVGLGAAGLIGAAIGAMWFGRRLAIARERNGYVREEDRVDELGTAASPMDT